MLFSIAIVMLGLSADQLWGVVSGGLLYGVVNTARQVVDLFSG